MEKKDYYTLKEIILGLNHEYQQHEKELEKLKEFCGMDERKTTDFNFRLFQATDKNPVLLCDYEPKYNTFQKLIMSDKKRADIRMSGYYTATLATDGNRYHFLYPEYPIHIKYDYGMDEKFFNQANAILNSEFAKNIWAWTECDEINCSDIRKSLTIEPDRLSSYIKNDDDSLQSYVAYNPFDNTMIFQMFEGNLSNKFVEDTLNLEFSSSELNPYHITSIHASKMAEKPIVLGYISPVDRVEFAIMEEEKQVVLSKRT